MENFDENNLPQKTQQDRFSKPLIAGVLMLIAGGLGLLNWIQILTIDVSTIESVIDIEQLKSISPTLTTESIVSLITKCAVVGVIVSIFPILGGLLSIKKKLWGISLTCSIIGIFSIGILFSSSLFCFISMILLIICRKDY